MADIIGLKMNSWYWYLTEEAKKLNDHKCGKWMYFFTDQEFAKTICEKAIQERVCWECKCSVLEEQGTEQGVICFYLNGDDMEHHKSVINFMMKNQLIKRTKTGRLYNISFKFDDQTRAGEYGADFEGKIKLEQYVNLNTGEWLV